MTEQLSPADRLLRIIADSDVVLQSDIWIDGRIRTKELTDEELAVMRIKADAQAVLADLDGMRERLEKDWPMKAEAEMRRWIPFVPRST